MHLECAWIQAVVFNFFIQLHVKQSELVKFCRPPLPPLLRTPITPSPAVFSPDSRDDLRSAVKTCLDLSSQGDCSTGHGSIDEWNVAKVTDMGWMFMRALVFNQDLSKWNVAKVTDMELMFHYASAFNQDLSKWNVAKVTNMGSMFNQASAFNQELSKWDVSKVTDMRLMFNQASAFNQDLSKWDVSNVTYMGSMFYNASSFNQDLYKWDVTKVTDMEQMFYHAIAFNQDLSKWDVSKVTNMDSMFAWANSFTQTLCGEAWINSKAKADKSDMFTDSFGSISTTVCGAWSNGIVLHGVHMFLEFDCEDSIHFLRLRVV